MGAEDGVHQAKFSLDEDQVAFLDRHRHYGFKDRSAVVRAALDRLREEIRNRELDESARLWAELYEEDPESQAWVEDASRAWPG